MIKTFKNTRCVALVLLVLVMVSSPTIYAATATTTLSLAAGSFVTGITTVLKLLGIGIATIAVFIFGYQVGFTGKSAAQAAPILIGGFIIGAAATIGSALVGNTSADYGNSITRSIQLQDSELVASTTTNSNALFEFTPTSSVN